ncbi:phage minor head protein [Paracoccus sp. (in: a-proteobacteria)]|uniref:phage head morphogenesis protein n=1 Tax=Paracoccus sp. TaxID=267 RepID=UPI0026E0DB3E|nr:phage minor head protein [Paracoccus sp. (in: a-proteobacteria)]MDO5648854.1 phage minor head protein [Paracoccus sp. (in: a-proteobacteria)]
MLNLIRGDLDKAMAEGWTLKQFQDNLAPRLRRAGWWGKSVLPDPKTGEMKTVQLGSMQRLRVIFDTNMRTALAAGRWKRIQEGKRRFPYLRYVQIDRPSKRPDHARYHDLVRPVDDPVWLRIYPPNGWFCACDVRQITQGQIDRGTYTVSEPITLEEDWHSNPRTGHDEMVPEGVTPGFDTNPGAVRHDMDQAFSKTGLETRDELANLAADLAERMRREDRERAVVIQPDRDVRDRYVGEREGVHVPKSDPGSDVIHSHPDYPALSQADLINSARAHYRSIFGVTPQGEVFGVRLTDDAHLHIDVAIRGFSNEWVLPGNQWELKQASDWQHTTLQGHLMSRWLEEKGVLAYFQPKGPRIDSLLSDYAGLIDVVMRSAR